MVADEIRTVLESRFSSKDIRRALQFLDRDFSKNGQVVICSIFIFADDNGKSFDVVLSAVEAEWSRNWQYQHPGIKGDPDAPGAAGTQNRASLENVYHALGIPSPLSRKQTEAPDGGLKTRELKSGTVVKVRTRNSVYVLTFTDPQMDLVHFHGGKYFPQETPGKFMGSEVMGGILSGVLCKGASLWICHHETRPNGNLRTSSIQDYEVIPPQI